MKAAKKSSKELSIEEALSRCKEILAWIKAEQKKIKS